MLRTIYGDDDRYRETYWSKWDGIYFPGDGAKRGENGYFWVLGRVDDVLNVAGHRIGTMEVESALVDHTSVAEAAVVGKTHDVKGQAIAAFVTLKENREPSAPLGKSSGRMSLGRSGRSLAQTTSCSRPIFPRRARARSCAGSYETSRKVRR